MRHIPQRSCIVCRAQRDKSELIRIVRGADGNIVCDASGKAAGRGAYICRDGSCIETALKKRALNRAFKAQIPDSVYLSLKEELGADAKGQV